MDFYDELIQLIAEDKVNIVFGRIRGLLKNNATHKEIFNSVINLEGQSNKNWMDFWWNR